MDGEIIKKAVEAAKGGDQETIERLVAGGFPVNQADEHGFTMLMEAAEYGHAALFWYLVRRGADLFARTEEGFTVVHAVALGGDVHMLEFVLARGVDGEGRVTSREHAGYSARDYARMGGNHAVARRLQRI